MPSSPGGFRSLDLGASWRQQSYPPRERFHERRPPKALKHHSYAILLHRRKHSLPPVPLLQGTESISMVIVTLSSTEPEHSLLRPRSPRVAVHLNPPLPISLCSICCRVQHTLKHVLSAACFYPASRTKMDSVLQHEGPFVAIAPVTKGLIESAHAGSASLQPPMKA